MARRFPPTCRPTVCGWPNACCAPAKRAFESSDGHCARRPAWQSMIGSTVGAESRALRGGCGSNTVPLSGSTAALRLGRRATDVAQGQVVFGGAAELHRLDISRCGVGHENQTRRSRVRLFTRNRAALLAIGATLLIGSGLIGPGASAGAGSLVSKANGRPASASRKPG